MAINFRKINVADFLRDAARAIATVFGWSKTERRLPMEWPESNDPEIPESSPSWPRRPGIVRVEGRAFADGAGQWNPVGTTLFWALWGERHDAPKIERNLKHVATYGLDYIRILGMVGVQPAWQDRVIDPRWPDYWQVVDGLAARARRYGRRLLITIFADAQVMMPDPRERERFLDRWIDWVNAHADLVFAVEIANEHWQNGLDRDEVRRLGERARARCKVPVALGAPQEHDVIAMYREWPGVATLHYQRKTSTEDGPWRPVRQPWGWPGEYREAANYHGPLPGAAINSEPIGPFSSVEDERDPVRIALAMATTFVAGNGAYCYHTGAGVMGGNSYALSKGRPANLDEVDQRIIDAIRATRALLPAGLANWTRTNSQWTKPLPEFPWDGSQRAVERGDIVRAFGAMSGTRFVGVFLGVRRPHEITTRRAIRLDLMDPTTGRLMVSAQLPAGSKWTVPAMCDGYLVLGEFI